jgi:hypothetical protein
MVDAMDKYCVTIASREDNLIVVAKAVHSAVCYGSTLTP